MAPGTPESLSRTRSAARRDLVGDRDLRSPPAARPWLSAAPAPVVQSGEPGAADAPRRSDPAARDGRSCRRRPPPGAAPDASRELGSDPARRGVGVLGQQRHPALARAGSRSRCRRWRRSSRLVVSVIRTPGCGPDHLAALRQDQLDQRRVLARDLAPAPARGRRARPRQAPQPALGLGDDLLRDDDDLAVGRGRPQRRSAAPRSIALVRPRAMPGQRPHPQLAGPIRRPLRASGGRRRRRADGVLSGDPPSSQSELRPCAAQRALGRRAAARRGGSHVLGRVEVERQRIESLEREADPGRAGAGDVPRAAVGTEGGLEGVGRREDQAVGAGAVAVGDDQRRARGVGRVCRRARRGPSAGSRWAAWRRARPPELERGADAGARGLECPASSVCSSDLAARASAPAGRRSDPR